MSNPSSLGGLDVGQALPHSSAEEPTMSIVTINGRMTPHAYKTSDFRPVDNTTCCESVAPDAGYENGFSQLERGHLSMMNPRTANAMRVSLESALRDIASRFGLKAVVTQAVPRADRADFVVVLQIQQRS
jgi:hypothetical protein